MPRIFISYRRTDSRKDAARIYDRLVNEFGKDNVFKDVDSIPFGADFRKVISDEVNKCAAVLVIVGPQWLDNRDEYGNRRLDDTGDFVRIEIETGLNRKGAIVVPVLVDGAPMPKAGSLPHSLQELAFKNAAPIRDDPDFHRDMSRLIDGLKQWFNVPQASAQPEPAASSMKQIKRAKSVVDILPAPFEWCDIPKGIVNLDDVSSLGGTKGGRSEVPAFTIAKHPITNAQYQIFVDALDGYRDDHWWNFSSEAKSWREQHPQSIDTAFPGNDLPRTNVSWHDAIAFCRWLSNLAVQKITLPTEQQWQRAAQGDDNRTYPWGNDIDDNHCNYGNKIGKPTPVTDFPRGASPYGVMNMAGNVWEWCLTEWGTDDGTRAVRGGSWGFDNDYMRAAARNGNLPSLGLINIGFRCVRS